MLAHNDDDLRALLPRYLKHWKASVITISNIDETKRMALDACGKGKPFDVICVGSSWPYGEQMACVQSLQAEKKLSATHYVVACLNRVKAERKDIENTIYVVSVVI